MKKLIGMIMICAIAAAASSTAGMAAPESLKNAPELTDDKTYVPAEFFELLYYNVKVENIDYPSGQTN